MKFENRRSLTGVILALKIYPEILIRQLGPTPAEAAELIQPVLRFSIL